MSSASADAPSETAVEIPTATEAGLIEMVLGMPGVAPRILGVAALPSLGRLSPAALAERAQIALPDATRLAAAFELGRRYHAARARRGARLTDAARVARYFGPKLASLVDEELWIAALDMGGRVRETRMLGRGGADSVYVGYAAILRAALDMAALSFVLVHNHPSGDPTPTEMDHAMTEELRRLSYELNVPLKAHVIVTPSGRYSAVLE
ncbi:DNA repair protein [Sorangium cellulosum]|uniref:DNA repair protein n=1 Tax=Sorangium cellulosum TaxID=56 RepID=A0A2L0EVF4_SORCE|nr:JAB domain-containing protein [Sorangium cellulosum]AUX43288.1 DNA repair protein [Sorangium cellulosum]